jgi:hypothetical protein
MKSGNATNTRLRELADKIANEQDQDKFTELVKEFNQLLEGKLHEPHDSAPPKNT